MVNSGLCLDKYWNCIFGFGQQIWNIFVYCASKQYKTTWIHH